MKKDIVVKSSHYGHKPWWFKALNTAWSISYPLGTRSSIDKDSLIKAARKATGLNDFGRDFWDEPLDRLLLSIKQEADLHPIGTFITRQRMINLLCVRLRAEEMFRRHPEILDQPQLPVWVILGLQRTGTTKLHRLLAADPDNRVLLSWEALNPVPLINLESRIENRESKRVTRNPESEIRNPEPGTRNPEPGTRN